MRVLDPDGRDVHAASRGARGRLSGRPFPSLVHWVRAIIQPPFMCRLNRCGLATNRKVTPCEKPLLRLRLHCSASLLPFRRTRCHSPCSPVRRHPQLRSRLAAAAPVSIAVPMGAAARMATFPAQRAIMSMVAVIAGGAAGFASATDRAATADWPSGRLGGRF
jgi:hypothetical protein